MKTRHTTLIPEKTDIKHSKISGFNKLFVLIDQLKSIQNIKDRTREFELIFLILKTWNFRISEVLSLNIDSLVSPNKIIVKLSKCKDYFVISDDTLYNFLLELFTTNSCNKFCVEYDEFYRWFLKNKSEYVLDFNQKYKKVTHSFRYTAANNFKQNLKSKSQIQALLRHKSHKTQRYYLK